MIAVIARSAATKQSSLGIRDGRSAGLLRFARNDGEAGVAGLTAPADGRLLSSKTVTMERSR